MTIPQAFEVAIQHHQVGRLTDAEALYRQILSADPHHSDALHLLGVIAHQVGRHDLAVNLIRQAIALNPSYAEAHNNLGNALRDQGLLDEAIAAYRHAIALKPTYAEAHYNFGNALRNKGQMDDAIAGYRHAIALKPTFAEAHSSLGNALYDTDQFDEAIVACRQAIALKSDFADAYSNLGNALYSKGQLDEAIAAYRQAIALNPNFAEFQNNLGNALRDRGQLDEAIAAHRQAIALNPNFPEAYNNLGNALNDKGQLDEAIAAYRQAVTLKPNFPEAHNHLGSALREKGSFDEAVAVCRQAIALKPTYAEAHNNLGNALRDQGLLDEAIAACHQAIALKPHFAEGCNNYGNALYDNGQLDEAIAAYRQAIALKPTYAEAFSNLGISLKDKGQLDEAIAAHRQAIALKPGYAEAFSNLGNALKGRGQLDEAIAACRQAIAAKPSLAEGHTNLILVLNYHPDWDAPGIAQEQRRWNRQQAQPLRRFIQAHVNDRNPERRLRIGYVSADFRAHVVGYNMLPVLSRHDPKDFEIFCYAQVLRPDAFTERFRASAQHWRNAIGQNDEQLAAQIRHDRIDLLVDLALHTAGNRLPAFALKPAPVQVTFAGYPGSTGLGTIDYRLSDPYLDPPGMDESLYSEQTVRLPNSFWCYDPLDCRDIPVRALPAQSNGYITFGCLNSFCKINASVLRLWAKVLRAVPSSRLLLLAPDGSHRQHTVELLRQEGIASQRIEFVIHQPRRKYLELYHRIDLGLDTLPYNGHTTSLDSYWMGVPVVTLVGQTVVGRAGLSQLTNLKLTELISSTPEDYVNIASGLASDLPRLAELRCTLRQRMEASPLMDAPRFTRDIEAAYREMWLRWCANTEQPV